MNLTAPSPPRAAPMPCCLDEADACSQALRSQGRARPLRHIETAYLLQKMEDHDGIVILATNLAKNIDEAFSRRMQFVVEFPMPDVASREALWRRMLRRRRRSPPTSIFAFLARQFTLAGGDIRNIVLDAAYQAARADRAIAMPDLLRAVSRQNAKRGRVSTVAEFREYFPLLAESAGSDGLAEPSPAGERMR